jgi:hypothetical protein
VDAAKPEVMGITAKRRSVDNSDVTFDCVAMVGNPEVTGRSRRLDTVVVGDRRHDDALFAKVF